MSFEQCLSRAWQRQAKWLWLLLPLAWLYALADATHRWLYRWGLKKTYYAPVPLIVIGNITAGGSGKTPLLIGLVNYLQTRGVRVGVISRGHGGDETKNPQMVHVNSLPQAVGDEPCLIVQSTGVPMAVGVKRGAAVDLLLQHYPGIQLILADDGLQHYALDRDADWIVVDAERGFGNQQRLPVGFLRQPIRRLFAPNTTVIWHCHNWQQPPMSALQAQLAQTGQAMGLFMRLAEQPLKALFDDATHESSLLPNRSPQVIAMTGIGYPPRFFASLQRLGFGVVAFAFDDHHAFTLADFAPMQVADLVKLPIVVTAKDAVKIRPLLAQDTSAAAQNLRARLWVLPVEAELSPAVYATLNKQLNDLNILNAYNHIGLP